MLAIFCLYNIEMYLRRQGRWRVFPLSLFYALSFAMICVRCYVAIDSVEAAKEMKITVTLYPAILQIMIGIVQIEVIIELIIRVNQ